jgi:predicted dehydrogenase
MLAEARVVLGWSRSADSRQRWAAEFGVPSAPSWDACCASEDVDAVLVCTPHSEHYAQAKMALLAGKHVLVETPLALRYHEARELAELASESCLVLHHGAKWRYHPEQEQYIANLRRVGRLLVGADQWTWDYGSERGWYDHPQLTGGARSFLSYTLVDWLEAYGEVAAVVGSEVAVAGWESASLLLTFAAGGNLAVGYAVGRGLPDMNQRYVIGRTGAIQTTPQGVIWMADGASGPLGRTGGDVVLAECQAFLDEMRGRRDPAAHLARDLRAQQLVEEALGAG